VSSSGSEKVEFGEGEAVRRLNENNNPSTQQQAIKTSVGLGE
jgi:hypothetical protein